MRTMHRSTVVLVSILSICLVAAAEPETQPAPSKADTPAAAPSAPAADKTPAAPAEAPSPKDAFKDLATRLLARTLEEGQWLRIRDRFDTAVNAALLEDEVAAYQIAAKAAPAKARDSLEARFKALLETIPLIDATYISLRATLEEALEACLPSSELIALGLKSATTAVPTAPAEPEPIEPPKGPTPVPTATIPPEGGDSQEEPGQPPAPPAKVPAADSNDPLRPMPTGRDPGWDSLHDGNVPIRARGSGTYNPDLDAPSLNKNGSAPNLRSPDLDSPTLKPEKKANPRTPRTKTPKVKKQA